MHLNSQSFAGGVAAGSSAALKPLRPALESHCAQARPRQPSRRDDRFNYVDRQWELILAKNIAGRHEKYQAAESDRFPNVNYIAHATVAPVPVQEIESCQCCDSEQNQYRHTAEEQSREGNSKVESEQPRDYDRGRNQQEMEQRDSPKSLPDKYGRAIDKFV